MIYILLPVHNRREITLKFVACLERQTDRDFHLVLIDDGSLDGTAEAVMARLPGSTVIHGSGKWWWAGSLQQGYHWLRKRALEDSDLVLIANDDTSFDENFLQNARAAVAGSPDKLLLARLHDEASGKLVEVGVQIDWKQLRIHGVMDPATVNCFSTRGLFLSARTFLGLGGFSPRMLPHYLSDYAFTIKAHRRGLKLTSDDTVRLWYDDASTGVRVPAPRSPRDYLRSTLSRRSPANPLAWTSFLLLACPREYLLRNVYRVWRTYWSGLRDTQRDQL